MSEDSDKPAIRDIDRALEFIERLVALDMALTGRSYEDATGAFNEQRAKAVGPEFFLGATEGCHEAYYLSDDGRSRLYCEGPSLRLSPSSTAQVKGRWEGCRAERGKVEEMLALAAADAEDGASS